MKKRRVLITFIKELAKHLAKKRRSLLKTNKTFLIMGCDQILECKKQIISKPENQAKKLFVFKRKKHKLHTCLYVLKKIKNFY